MGLRASARITPCQLRACKSKMIDRLLFHSIFSQSDKIVSLTTAAGCPVEPIWATLLAKALDGKSVKDMLTNVGSGSGGAAIAAPAAAAGGAAAPAAEEKKEEKKEEEKEESDGESLKSASAGMVILIALHFDRRHGIRSLRLIYHSRLHSTIIRLHTHVKWQCLHLLVSLL